MSSKRFYHKLLGWWVATISLATAMASFFVFVLPFSPLITVGGLEQPSGLLGHVWKSGQAFLLLSLGVGGAFLGRRVLAGNAADILRRDNRIPVLYLRSFVLDDDKMLRRADAITAEDHIVRGFKCFGPVISVGRPEERLRLPGSARFYLDGRKWRTVIKWLVPRVRLVAIRMGPSEGLRWELKHVLSTVAPSNVVLFGSPEDWERYHATIQDDDWELPQWRRPADWMFVHLTDDAAAVLHTPVSRWKANAGEFIDSRPAGSRLPVGASEICEYLEAEALAWPPQYPFGPLAVTALATLLVLEVFNEHEWFSLDPAFTTLTVLAELTAATVVPLLVWWWQPTFAKVAHLAVLVPLLLVFANARSAPTESQIQTVTSYLQLWQAQAEFRGDERDLAVRAAKCPQRLVELKKKYETIIDEAALAIRASVASVASDDLRRWSLVCRLWALQAREERDLSSESK